MDELVGQLNLDRLRAQLTGQADRNLRETLLRLLMLSHREMEVLSCFTNGNATKDVARILLVSPSTVSAHSASILHKLAATSRLHAVAIALRAGIFADQKPGVRFAH